MKKALYILLLSLLPLSALGQTRAETSQYNRVVKRPAVKTAEAFLKKYPQSVYAPKVERIRDSLLFFALKPEDAAGVLAFAKAHPESAFKDLAAERIREHNTSSISAEEALAVAGECLGAVGWKKDNVDHVLALDSNLELRILSPDGTLEQTRSIPLYSLTDLDLPLTLALQPELIAPLGNRNYLHFAYMNGDAEYVEVLYLPEEDLVNQAMFYGKAVPGGIEGQSPEAMEGLQNSGEVNWLLARLKENPSLIQISQADLLTDNAIRWWLDRNPNAASSASKLTFGKLDPESSIAAAFTRARKERGKGYSAALFDIRGYTVICALRGGEPTLVWCEPVCKNRSRDRFLNSIYFDSDGTTLVLFYYKGSSTFKYRISLASQSIRR